MTELQTPSPNPAHDTGELPGLTLEERSLLAKMFSDPLAIPPEWKAWLVSYLEANPPVLPISQIFGYQQASQATRVSNGSFNINASSNTMVHFSGEEFDYGNLFDPGDDTKITVASPGKYVVGAYAQFAANGTGDRVCAIIRGGAFQVVADQRPAASAAITSNIALNTVLDLSAGDYIELQVYQSSGGILNVAASMWVARLTS